MNRRFAAITFMLCLAAFPALSRGGEIVDRIVATVNGQVILQSDWDDALRYQAFVDAHSPQALTGEEQKAALDHLIDQELLREQIHSSDFHQATDEQVAKRIQEIRQQYPGAETPDGWNAVLSKYGFTEAGMKQHVALEIDLLRLVDSRLRPNVNIDSKSIESYYNQELLPQLRQSGAQEVPLAQVTPQIRELLTQQKVNELLVAWLQNLRSGSEIRTSAESPDSGGELR
jgi:peptidyl-prolyl cis-trans isomerase SurA